jgi:hypothetical protein
MKFTLQQIAQRKGARRLTRLAVRSMNRSLALSGDGAKTFRRDEAKQYAREACRLAFLAHPELRES